MPIRCIFLASKLFIPLLFLACQSGLESIGLTSLEVERSSLQQRYVLRNEDVLNV